MLNRWRTLTAEMGVWNALWYALHRGLSTLSGDRAAVYRYYLTRQSVPGDRLCPSRRGVGLDIVQIAERSVACDEFPRPRHVIKSRFAQGAVCFGALRKGELVGYLWLTLHAYQEDEVRATFFPIPTDRTAWDFDVYVAPKERLGAGFLRLWDSAFEYLRQRGIEWTMSRISAFNPGSVAAHRRMGAELIGTVTFVVWGRWQLLLSWRYGPHVQLSRSRRPVVRVAAS